MNKRTSSVVKNSLIDNLGVNVEWFGVDEPPTKNGIYWVVLSCGKVSLDIFSLDHERFLDKDKIIFWSPMSIRYLEDITLDEFIEASINHESKPKLKGLSSDLYGFDDSSFFKSKMTTMPQFQLTRFAELRWRLRLWLRKNLGFLQ